MNRREFCVHGCAAMFGAPLYSRFASIPGVIVVEPTTRVFVWERGIAVESRAKKDMAMFLWFYEWNMFDAARVGEHTGGSFESFRRSVNADQTEAQSVNDQFRLTIKATDTGADLDLHVTNRSENDWPVLAAIIPCLSPGKVGENLNERRGAAEGLLPPRNAAFANENTFFLGPAGLERLNRREIRFNSKLNRELDAASRERTFGFSEKWPTARPEAAGGLMVRESTDGRWVSGIAWDDFLSVQAHNPWQCMHLAPRVGPLKRNESKTLRGKLYLFPGTSVDCLNLYRKDFS